MCRRLCAAIAIVIFSSYVHASSQGEAVRATNALAADLYDQLGTQEGNLFFSPYSISSALAMTYAGARASTREEMAQVLHFSSEGGSIHSAFAALEQGVENTRREGEIKIDVANSLWPQDSYPLSESFKGLIDKHYKASVEPLDFRRDPEGARRKINRWVDKKTNGMIEELIAADVLSPLTRLVLVNAIYFNGLWENPFLPKATHPGNFNLSTGKTIEVEMMHTTDDFGYADHGGFQVLEMAYKSGGLSMLVLLPGKDKSLTDLEKSLTADNLKGWTGSLTRQEVAVSFPKFKMGSSFGLSKTLKALGMEEAFTQSADLSGIAGNPGDLFIGSVVHKAVVEVNEKGTEAAAATGVTLEKSSFRPPVTFTADRPFLFLIRDNATDTILFLGRVTNPAGG